jgi:uncharacterized protein YjaZ
VRSNHQLPGVAGRSIRALSAAEQWFSGAPDRDGDLPGRCGYWLGWDLMNSVLTQVSLDTAMTWPLAEASGRLQRQLETLTS